MKKYTLLFTVILALFSSFDLSSNATRLEVEVGDGPYQDDIIWSGPGWYYGIWFDSEIEYIQWRRYNHRYHRRGHRGGHHWRHGGHRGGHHGRHHGGRHH